MTAPELQSFHVGIVVRDLGQAIERYSSMFGIDVWYRGKARFNGLEMAYGLGPGQSFEFFQVTGSGDSHIHQFFDEHGEGVNHIGMWTEDVPAAVRKALDAGAELMSLSIDGEGNAAAQFVPPAKVTSEDFANLGVVTFARPTGGVLIEYVGRAGEELMRRMFQEKYDHVVPPAPWSR